LKSTPDEISAQFAARAPIGTPCIYYPLKPFDRGDGVNTRIRSEPWVLGHGAVVVAIEGRAGGVSIEHLVFEEDQTNG
jgi:hypothetical protein